MKKLFTTVILIITTANVFAQCYYHDQSNPPEELFRKRVKEDKMRYGNPYTMFVRGDNFDVNVELQKIRNNIKIGAPIFEQEFLNDYAKLYAAIYKYADTPEPDRCPELEEEQTCLHPAWVKNNAIVYLIGLKYSVVGGVGRFDSLIPSDKQEFFEKAKQGLRNLNPNVNTCNWGLEYEASLFTLGTSVRCGKVRIKAAELTLYLQAYDLLKTGEGGIAPNDGDRNSSDGDCSPRNKLREFTRNLYVQSNSIVNSSTGWKKNHGIICLSAIGLGAIVLNDAGVETNLFAGIFGWLWGDGFNLPHPNYSPINWYERAFGNIKDGNYRKIRAEHGIEDHFFVGHHNNFFSDVPQTSPDGKAGYAEGPGYFNDLAATWFPYLRASDNFLPSRNPKNYLAPTIRSLRQAKAEDYGF